MSSSKTFTTQSGETLKLVKVSQGDLIQFQKSFKSLSGTNNIQGVSESELADRGVEAMSYLIELGVAIRLTPDQQEDVDYRKAKIERLFPGRPENKFDIYQYVQTLCPTLEEMAELSRAIIEYSDLPGLPEAAVALSIVPVPAPANRQERRKAVKTGEI
jgi:hypothetical protein